MPVTGKEMFDRGGGELVYDGEGAPGYAPQWGGGGGREGSQTITWAAHFE